MNLKDQVAPFTRLIARLWARATGASKFSWLWPDGRTSMQHLTYSEAEAWRCAWGVKVVLDVELAGPSQAPPSG